MARPTFMESSLPADQNLDPVEEEINNEDFMLPADEEVEEGDQEFLEIEPEPEPEPAPQPAPRPLSAREQIIASLKTDAERRAFAMGWVPKANFTGPGVWKPAEEWLARGQELNHVLRRDNAALRGEVETLKGTVINFEGRFSQMDKTISDLRDQNSRAEQAGFDRAMAELKAQRNTALQNQDLVQAAEIGDRIEDLRDQRAQRATAPAPVAPEPAPQPRAAVTIDPDINEFIANNPWFYGPRGNAQLNAAMVKHDQDVQVQMPGISRAEQLAEAKRRTVDEYPESFGMAPRAPNEPRQRQREPQRGPARPTGANGAQPARRASAFDAIQDPAERAEAIEGFQHYRKSMPDITAAEYLKLYLDPKADVLQVMRDDGPKRAAPQPRRTTNV